MKPLFQTLLQVGYVVGDLDQALEIFTQQLGAGPFLNVKFGSVDGDTAFNDGALSIEDFRLDGKYLGSYGIRMGAMQFGGIQLELIEPMENMSLFRQYLNQHGPGAQHLAMERTESFEMTLGRMAAAGYPIGSLAKVDRQEDCAFVRHAEPLGIAVELYHRPEGYTHPDGVPPMVHPDRQRHPEPLVDAITEVTFAVRELTPVLELLEGRYGIGPWNREGPGLHGERRAVGQSLGVRVELVQPPADPEDAMYQFLRNNGGNGIFSITFSAPKGVQAVLEAVNRPAVFGNAHAALVDFRDIFGTYFKFAG